ncbi:MAG: hypothetical protein ACXAB9_11230 [Candidatus Thorarchaeota archaeon]|jgi:hypothetical protein
MYTLVSIMPWAIREKKPGLNPGEFMLPPGSVKEPALFVIKKAQIRMMDQDYRFYAMDIPLDKVAADVVNCYNQALVGFEHEVAVPGFFWVEGAYEDDEDMKAEGAQTALEKLKKDHYKTILDAEKKMITWFQRLVRMADDDWAVLPQHQQISDIQRTAAKYVNVERPWLSTDVSESKRCPACMSIVQSAAAVCFACKAILDITKYEKMKFATA